MRTLRFGSAAILVVLASLLTSSAAAPRIAFHCDGMDGPVVKAAQRALETGNVRLLLPWVSEKDEAEARSVFEQALRVRTAGPEAKQLADRHLFETIVRLHRVGEGASFTGLQPAGRDPGPAISGAEAALARGNCDALSKFLVEAVERNLRDRFQDVLKKRPNDPDDVRSGRIYVKSYVEFMHFVERLHASATHPASGHHPPESGEGHDH